MKNKNGQALIEFILILPVVIILIFTTVDIFNLIMKKNDFESEISDQLNLLITKKQSLEEFENKFQNKKNYKLSIKKSDDYTEIIITKKHKWISPITKLILSNNSIEIKRVIPNE